MCCHDMSRRTFLGTAAIGAGMGLSSAVWAQTADMPDWPADMWDAARPYKKPTQTLRIQAVLMYRVPVPRERTSWKSWGDVQTHEAADEEAKRIAEELTQIAAQAAFPMEVLPVHKVLTPEEARTDHEPRADVTIVYPATGGGDTLRACLPEKGGLVFVRHRSGSVYYWYEALSVKYLRPSGTAESPDGEGLPISADDVVVDDLDDLAWRLHALAAVKNTVGTRIVAVGGPWGKYAPEAPQVAKDRYGLEIIDVSYQSIEPRIKALLNNAQCMKLAERWTDACLKLPGTTLATEREYVVNAFMLYGLFKDLMRENDATTFTIKDCMATIMPMSNTTACLTLGLLNDEGLLAFCESDFVIIPAGILLHHVAGKPVFLHNSTFPHKGIVTCAHCSSPRRFNGDRYEPTLITTHYESEFGAAPKVDVPPGQDVTFIDPEYATGRWVGMRGVVVDNPNLAICRSQQDVRIRGDWRKLLNEVRDSHWVMVYGDYLKEAGYAARRMGITWDSLEMET